MYYRILVALCFAILSCTCVFAQTQVTGVITLSDAVSAAVATNPALSHYPIKKEAFVGLRDSAELKPALSLNIELENIIGTGALNGIDRAEASLALSSVIEMGDKRASRVKVVNRRIDLLDVEQSIAQLDLIAKTALRFIDVVAAQERLKLQQQAVNLAQQTASLLMPLVRAGQTPQLELLRANAAVHRAKITRELASSLLESARIKLSTMWESQSPTFESASADFFAVGKVESLNPILINLANNPNVAIYATEQRLLDAQLLEARTQAQGNIQWSAGIRHLKEIDDTGLIFSVSAPLFNDQRASGAIKTAQANLAEVEIKRQSSLNVIRGQLYSLHQQLTQAISETVVLQQDVLPLLTDVLAQTRAAYKSGRYSYLELISAQQEYLDAELALINSAANAHTLRVEIERLSGEPLLSNHWRK